MPDWVNEIEYLIICKRNADTKFKVSDNLYDHKMYVRLQRDFRKKIRVNKKEFETRISHSVKKDPKEFLEYVRSQKNFRNTRGPLTNNNDTFTHDNIEIAS